MSADSPQTVEGSIRADMDIDGHDAVPPMLARSLEAYRRDLPRLLRTHRGKWVAHHGDEIVGIARTAGVLYKKCFGRDLKDDEFLVSCISAEIPDDEITWSPDV